MSATPARIRVWDLPTRIFHWTLAVLVVFSFTTGKVGGAWLDWHMRSGYAILTLLAFRLAWGVAGSETARFSSFVKGPVAFARYAADVAQRRQRAAVGHNPMGGWMVLFMLVVLVAQATSGLFVDDEIATRGPLAAKVSNAVVAKMSSFHAYNGWTVAVAVLLHVAAIAFYWFALRQNLVAPMWRGWSDAPPGATPPWVRPAWIAAVLLAIAAGAVYWLVMIFPRG